MQHFDNFINGLDFEQKIVLDLGAGKEGKFARNFVNRGAMVIAVDRDPLEEKGRMDYIFIRSRAEDYVQSLENEERYDLIHIRNLVQFLNKDFVLDLMLPKLASCLKPRGILAIQTFKQSPVPPFEHNNHSYFDAADLKKSLSGTEILLEVEHQHHGPDMKKVRRDFYLTTVIAQKA